MIPFTIRWLFCVFFLAVVLHRAIAFAPTRPIILAFPKSARHQRLVPLYSSTQSDEPITQTSKRATKSFFFANSTTQQPQKVNPIVAAIETRSLGSQELLMLPRQYSPSEATFPQMTHVSVAVLNASPSLEALSMAVKEVMQAHPLLRSRVQGTGEPSKRIDLFQMVREGEPDPLQFSTDIAFTSASVLQNIPTDDVESSWKQAFNRYLDDGGASWCDPTTGPLWKLEYHSTGKSKDDPSALLFVFNHAISDQSSANRLLHQIMETVADIETNKGNTSIRPAQKKQQMPLSLEESVLGAHQQWSQATEKKVSLRTLGYVAGKASEGLQQPVILPDSDSSSSFGGSLSLISGQAAGGMDSESKSRQSTLQFRSLSAEATSALLNACRENGVSMTNLLTAAVTLTASDFMGTSSARKRKTRNYKVLQSLDMRRFGAKLDKGETVACMAGSMDLMFGPVEDGSGQTLRRYPTDQNFKKLWELAKQGKQQTTDFINSSGPEDAVRVFDFAMTISDLTNLVYLSSISKSTKGRAYSAGITNVGVFEQQEAFEREEDTQRGRLKTKFGRYEIEDVFYATPHTQSGCLYPVSCMTVNGALQTTFHPISPIVNKDTSEQFASAFIDLLRTVATGKARPTSGTAAVEEMAENSVALPENALVLATALAGLVAVTNHGQAWLDFYQSVMSMKGNVESSDDFWSALNFWIFFAAGHAILQPILWISEVLHATPGPQVGGLVPILFVAGNAAVIWAMSSFKQVRDAVNVALIAAFFTYVGAGLDGQGGLGDFNLALDDSFQGKVVKGCPSYEDVRQPSMNDFDLKKYQGLWYEIKFHDWTQFKEVYDTTLDIKLTENGQGWVDDFAVRGPAPEAALLSWDKSPVANGAHYFLFGRVDVNDAPGILREKGFGVEFPNYIVDVRKDAVTGEYKEAIQFQCLERGGVRVFEGINFMSRNPVMTDEEKIAMHARAERAGMYPYGASPEQMHDVARKLDKDAIDNNWQQMWHNAGLDKLLELLTESIEDGGR